MIWFVLFLLCLFLYPPLAIVILLVAAGYKLLVPNK